jgi:DNA polymerase-3 subunit delta
MKWSASQLQQNLKQITDNSPPLVLIYGEDFGVIRECARSVYASVVADLNDPFLNDKIDVDQLVSDNLLIKKSADTLSFGGGVKLVRVDGVTESIDKKTRDALVASIKYCMDDLPTQAVIVLTFPGLDAKSALAKKVEAHKQAIAIRCFHDNSRDMSQIIGAELRKYGLTASSDVMSFLLDNLGNDRQVTAQEIQKLITYVGKKQEVTLEDCFNVIASAPSMNIFALCDAVALRDSKKTDKYLQAMMEQGEDLNMAFSLVLRHLRRIMSCQDSMAKEGCNAQTAMNKLRPPVFMNKPEFARQVQMYPKKRLNGLYDRFYTMQLESREGILSPNDIIERGIIGLSL